MSLKAFPFDSRIVSYDADGLPIYDRASNAEDFAKLLSSFFVSGVFGSSMCEVLQSNGMSVTVGAGQALVNGRFATIVSPETVTLPGSEGLNRIDTVVIRLDLSSAVNYIVTDVVKGTAATNPTAPALTRNGTVWELGLANILVPANSTAVSQANITDTRLNDARCGLVAAVLTDVDTSTLYNQIQAELAHFKTVEEQGIRDFVASIETILDGDVAANLAAEVASLDAKMATKTTNVERQVSLPVSSWMAQGDVFSSSAVVDGVTPSASVVVSPPTDRAKEEEYVGCSVRATSQGNNLLVFTALTKPTIALTANVMILSVNAEPEIQSEKAYVEVVDGAGPHNAIYRGKYLGSAVTNQQWAAISAGTFEDLYIGDYWTIGGKNWRIAAFDYYLRAGDTDMTTHHVTLVPDATMYNHAMNNSNVTTGGYVGSKMYTTGLAGAKTTINNAFGSAHILTHRQYLCNAVSNGKPSDGSWCNSTVELMTEQNVYGGKVFGAGNDGSTVPELYTVDKSQYPLFAFRPDLISNRTTFWLRDVVSDSKFAVVCDDGSADCYGASNAYGVRPAFSIIG